jgi:hypothetical protein
MERPPSPTCLKEMIDEHLIDEMCCEQDTYDRLEVKDGEYFIGYASVVRLGGAPYKEYLSEYLLLNTLETGLFYKYPFDLVEKYMGSCISTNPAKLVFPVSVQIIKVLRLPGDHAYYAINKTGYFRQFQRRIRAYLKDIKYKN